MVTITKQVEVSVKTTPYRLGIIFADMFSCEQAEFFHGVADAVKEWTVVDRLQWVAMREDLNEIPDALKVFKSMAKYAEDN